MTTKGRPSDRKIAFITGAASGIGRATAELFAENGFWVGAADRNTGGLEELRDALGKDRCRPWHLDVTDREAYERVIAELGEETGGRLDLLYNNAGVGAAGFFEHIPIEETLKVIDINLIGVINGIYAALPLLKQTPNSLCFSSSSSAPSSVPKINCTAAPRSGAITRSPPQVNSISSPRSWKTSPSAAASPTISAK